MLSPIYLVSANGKRKQRTLTTESADLRIFLDYETPTFCDSTAKYVPLMALGGLAQIITTYTIRIQVLLVHSESMAQIALGWERYIMLSRKFEGWSIWTVVLYR